MSEWILLATAAFAAGWLSGHNFIFARTASDVAFAAKTREAMRRLERQARLTGEGFPMSTSGNFIFGGREYIVRVERPSDGVPLVLQQPAAGQGESA